MEEEEEEENKNNKNKNKTCTVFQSNGCDEHINLLKPTGHVIHQ